MKLHGRDREQQVIDGLLASARAGRSGVLVVRGEAGIGKTALLEYAAAAADGMLVLRAAGVETEAELAFAGLHLLLRPVLDKVGTLPGPQATALHGALGMADRGSQDRFLAGLAVLSLLSELAEVQPVLCLVDDAHWLDAASSGALLFTARRLEAEGVVMVLAARDGPPPFAAPGLCELPLAPLAPAQAGRLLDERAVHLAPALRGRVLTEADGNPLALVELATALISDSAPAGTGPLPVTHSVRELLADQIRQLGEPTALLLLLAAAEATGDLTHVLPAAGALSTGADALAAAERAGLVAVNQDRLVFRHPLVRAAAYHGAPLALRQAAHRALADALDGQPDPDGRRAWHRAAAATGRDESVAAELVQSAERSRGRGGYAAVSAAYERAAQLTPAGRVRARRLLAAASAAADAGQPDRAERLAAQAQQLTDDDLLRAEITLLRMTSVPRNQRERIAELAAAVALIGPRYPDRAAQMICLALQAATARTEPELTRRLVAQFDELPLPPGTRLEPMHEAMVFRARFMAGHPGIDVAFLRDCVAAIRRDPDGAAPAARVHASVVAFWLGDHETTREISAALAADCRRHGMVGWLAGTLQGVVAAQIVLGEWTAARASAHEGLKLARDLDQLPRAAFLSAMLALLAALTGDEDGCRAWMAEHHRLGGSARLQRKWRAQYLALADLAHGRFGQARDRLAGIPRIWQTGVDHLHHPDMVEAGARSGDPDLAGQALAAFEVWVNLTGQPWARAVAHRCRALVSDDPQAEPHYRAAITGHQGDGRPFEQARTHLVYGEWLRRQRRRGDARLHLATAHQIFTELGAAAWAERAASELAAAGAAPAGRAPGPAGIVSRLTPQELQVVQLAAEGLSNRDIGAQLFLSPRTVGYHLYKAYPKLGVGSRTELARLLSREDQSA
ncbi:MAG TPA: AAA family ATPase [Streptosporangiaceae bacterium]|nr:AAA family ATPase [Streptosporangiaceae bacterium]